MEPPPPHPTKAKRISSMNCPVSHFHPRKQNAILPPGQSHENFLPKSVLEMLVKFTKNSIAESKKMHRSFGIRFAPLSVSLTMTEVKGVFLR